MQTNEYITVYFIISSRWKTHVSLSLVCDDSYHTITDEVMRLSVDFIKTSEIEVYSQIRSHALGFPWKNLSQILSKV